MFEKQETYQYDLNGNFVTKWNSISEAAKSVGGSYKNISAALNQPKQYSAYGFIWLKEENQTEANRLSDLVKITRENNVKKCMEMRELRVKPILMLDLETGETLREFASQEDAKRFLGLKDSTGISNVVRGKYKSTAGYGWREA